MRPDPNITPAHNSVSATRSIVAVVGILCGFSGLEHGFFETLQGNVRPEALLINAIGPAQRFWPGGTEPALTLVPSFLVTGILAMLAGLLVIVWSIAFVQKSHGAAGFFGLSLFQFLAGGGFAQIFLVVVTTAAATQILRPWRGWRRLPSVWGKFWLPLIVLFTVVLLFSMYAAIFDIRILLGHWVQLEPDQMSQMLYVVGYSLLALLPLTFLAGFAHDANRTGLTR